MPCHVKFSVSPTGADRIHYIKEDDVRVVLSRLPTSFGTVSALFISTIGAAYAFWVMLIEAVARSRCVRCRRGWA
jgi:hypothetical protein